MHTIKPNIKSHVIDAVIDLWGQNGAQHLIPIAGSSMYPLIQDGDHVLITHGCDKIHHGDVVVFRKNDVLFAHRVVKLLETGEGFACITKGDNVAQCDPTVDMHEIMGRVIAINRGRRHIECEGIIWRISSRFVIAYTLSWIWMDNRGYFIWKKYAVQGVPGFVSVIRSGLRRLFLLIRTCMTAILYR